MVSFDMLDKVYDAANCEKQKLVVEGAGHASSSSTEPELYWSTVFEFISVRFYNYLFKYINLQ